jgi:hypothetical protein
MKADSPIIDFYRSSGTDHRGRSLRQLQGQNPTELEEGHDYIQWLFPLPEPSSASEHAPVLSEADIEGFLHSTELQEALLDSLRAMLRFYGFTLLDTAATPTIGISAIFPDRARVWLRPHNHNFLRLTRILRSLSLLGQRSQARALFVCLEAIHTEHRQAIGDEALAYWRWACGDRTETDSNV